MRVPDGLFLMYPAMVLDLNYFLPSLLNTLIDPIVPFSILEVCIKSYLDAGVDPKYLYVSPGLCQDQNLIKQLPNRIHIITGSGDCLQDQSLDFLHKVKLFGKHPQVTIYKGFPHGFMNYAFPAFGLD